MLKISLNDALDYYIYICPPIIHTNQKDENLLSKKNKKIFFANVSLYKEFRTISRVVVILSLLIENNFIIFCRVRIAKTV